MPDGIPCVEDHRILDLIVGAFRLNPKALEAAGIMNLTRQGECIEFADRENGRGYEVVVREIDGDDEGEGGED